MKTIILTILLSISFTTTIFAYVPKPGSEASEFEKTVYNLNKTFHRRMRSTNRDLAAFRKSHNNNVRDLADSVDAEMKVLDELIEYTDGNLPKAYSKKTIPTRKSFLENLIAEHHDYFEKYSERYPRFR